MTQTFTQIRHSIFIQVLIALAIGTALGCLYPAIADSLKPLGDSFIKLIKMVTAPLVFVIIVQGIASHSELKHVGRIVGKTLLYFEVITLFALVLGIVGAQVTHIGQGIHLSMMDNGSSDKLSHLSSLQSFGDFFLNLIPDTFIGAFARGDTLQVLLISILFGVSLNISGEAGKPVITVINSLSHILFRLMAILVKVAPLGVLGAVAYMVGHYGVQSLSSLLGFLLLYSVICVLFVALVLGGITRFTGISFIALLLYLREELTIVLGTTASDVVLPQLMKKLEWLGISKSTVGLVIPTGYSFNLDGFSIYLTLAVVFIANATGVHLSWGEIALILSVAIFTSKGAHGVPGAAIVILAATLSAIPSLPLSALAFLLPIDWLIGIPRALTNVLGNCVATLVIAKWEKDLDLTRARQVLNQEIPYQSGQKEASLAAK
ncbi:cation:dicarboxylate symporter family transporter [Rosenbergiella australiborealis]|uniref:Cation:dicarboxylase symporter family transporter n=1 Tax=Rosenbergiella australiborealis TaxID=1544696 RepID=A0ABS5T626_9GAMM|nr:cation:dicarboxylase symporter family transporter [Rosenbergiella australiborealis]MBT0727790.1 cation:dicarboxylase symporter family transporter [Rosenbergiella australiborealis]